MALYKLILAYDGTGFSGFQRQGKARTVQGTLEKVLQELGWREDVILFAGRTDAGVHASGQVVTFTLDWHHSSADLVSALNARLPDDVSVQALTKEEAEFHPRYDASSRVYMYSIYHLPHRNPLKERFAWRIWPALDLELLNQAADTFRGRHDFAAYGRAMKKGGSTVREVFQSQWVAQANGFCYEIEANAFLYHMVRRLVYIQVCYARGTMSMREIVNGLISGAVYKPGLAPANGLVLTDVRYRDRGREVNEEEKN